MDGINFFPDASVLLPSLLENTAGNAVTSVTGDTIQNTEKTEKLAKDFESILLTKLFDEMKNTVGKWGMEEDAAAGQVQGLFWLYLARDVADKGGIGLWKDLQRFFMDMQNKNTPQQLLDQSL